MTMPSNDTPIVIHPEGPPRASVLWLHGLGADGGDFEPIVPELRLDPALGVRFVFPHAPVQPVTINGGMSMRAWFDIRQTDLGREQDEAGIRRSEQILRELVAAEIATGIPAERIVLAGFSQGGAIALQTALRFETALAGVMALSTLLPLEDSLATEARAANRQVPILMVHGTADPVIPVALARHSRAVLESAGYVVEWHDYPMAHSVCAEEIAVISRWLTRVLG